MQFAIDLLESTIELIQLKLGPKKEHPCELGGVIKMLRLKNNWSVKQFIKALGLKLSPAYINRVETRGHVPSPKVVIAMAKAFNISICGLLNIAKAEKTAKYVRQINRKYVIS